MSNPPEQDAPVAAPPPFPWLRVTAAALAVLAVLAAVYAIADGLDSISAGDPCDLDRRLHDLAATVGSRSVEVQDKALPGARLIRFQPNSDEYARVYACMPTGKLLEPTEVFELTPHDGSAESLAAQFIWVFKESRSAHLEVVTSADTLVALHFPHDVFAPPTLRWGVVSFLHADTIPGSGPEPRLYQVVIDSRTGLGGERWVTAHERSLTRASVIESLGDDGMHRELAFHLLAAAPQPDLLPELLSALESAKESQNPYLGLLGARGMPFADNGERLAKLAGGPAGKDVRMGVVQALATLAGTRPRELASSILARETDPRARRIMTAALSEQAPP